jgi:manganese efflux pump family protein
MIALLLLALAEATDTFAVSVAQGATTRHGWRDAARVAGAFGVAQGVMPAIGWAATVALGPWFAAWDHWVAFVLLGGLGAHMIKEGLERDAENVAQPLGNRALCVAAMATSIDAAATGIVLPTLGLPLLFSCAVIGVVTFVLCLFGVHFGGVLGARMGKQAELLGGVVLIGIGAMILGEHFGVGQAVALVHPIEPNVPVNPAILIPFRRDFNVEIKVHFHTQ